MGPVGRHAATIDRSLRDPKHTGVVTAALPEEMPVNETVEFERALMRELDMSVDAIVVNAVHPARFRAREIDLHPRGHRQDRRHASGRCHAALSEHTRHAPSMPRCAGCGERRRAPVTTLPRIFTPELSREDIERLSHELERKL